MQNKIDYTPKVSVIIPVYNVEPYLRQCLDSVINQTLKEIEIICVDDGSTDASLEILKEYAAKDKRITVLKQQNLHAGVARNAGLAVAKGEYLSFLDSDDFFELNMLEEMYGKASDKNADIVVCNANCYDNVSGSFENLSWLGNFELNGLYNTVNLSASLFSFFSTNCWNKLFSKHFIQTNQIYFQGLLSCNDVFFVYAALAASESIYIIKDIFVHYRKNTEKSLTAAYKDHVFDILQSFSAVKKFLQQRKFVECLESLYAKAMTQYIYVARKAQHIPVQKLINKYKTFFPNDLKQKFVDKIRHNVPIPIVLAINSNFAPYAAITIYSVMKNANPQYHYHFYILHNGLTKEAQEKILSVKKYDNMDISFKNVENYIKNLDFYSMLSHVSAETYFRFFIPKILPFFSRVIYIDCDLIVCNDISKLFYAKHDDCYISAVRNFVVRSQSYIESLGIDYRKYFNAGVLVLNIVRWQENNLTAKCLELLNSGRKYKFNDQDILNLVCKDHTKLLPLKWNWMWQFQFSQLPHIADLKEYEEASKDFSIIHYSSHRKPWNTLMAPKARLWWQYAFETGIFKYLDYIYLWYEAIIHQNLNLDNPKTFNEKIQWLKLYASTPIKTQLADKYMVRDWVKEKIGEEYLIPLLGVYDKFEDIDFEKLPDQFVIKCNHGSGWNIIVKDKSMLDLKEVKFKLDKWMNENFAFHAGLELHYRDIKPKIIIEKYIENAGGDLYDYKFWCFNGKVKYIQFLSERNLGGLKMAFYDTDWNKQTFVYDHPLDEKNIDRPDNLEQMIQLAEKLSQDFNHVRVDFYRLDDGTIVFGEMTFTPASGMMHWSDKNINKYFGKLITLPELAYNIDTGEYYKLPRDYHKELFKTHSPHTPSAKGLKAMKKTKKSVLSYKLFNFIPLFTYKKRGGNHVWKILGLPVWRVRKFENNITVKYYLFGIPFIKSSCK